MNDSRKLIFALPTAVVPILAAAFDFEKNRKIIHNR